MPSSTAVEQTDQRGKEELVEAVVLEVAEKTNADLLSLEPLYHSLDPGATDISGCVTFTYEGCEVLIDTAGEVHVSEAT